MTIKGIKRGGKGKRRPVDSVRDDWYAVPPRYCREKVKRLPVPLKMGSGKLPNAEN